MSSSSPGRISQGALVAAHGDFFLFTFPVVWSTESGLGSCLILYFKHIGILPKIPDHIHETPLRHS